MRLLHMLVSFSIPCDDLVNIYVLYVRSCQVWHSSLTLENFQALERVQKNALKIILQEEQISYSNALNTSGLSSLFERRSKLCLKFAKSCLKYPEMKKMFPLNPTTYSVQTRFREKFQVTINHPASPDSLTIPAGQSTVMEFKVRRYKHKQFAKNKSKTFKYNLHPSGIILKPQITKLLFPNIDNSTSATKLKLMMTDDNIFQFRV